MFGEEGGWDRVTEGSEVGEKVSRAVLQTPVHCLERERERERECVCVCGGGGGKEGRE